MSDKHNLDHPCRDTCSGWKQGYEKGRSEAFLDNEAMEILDENLANSEAKSYSDVIIGMQNLITKLIQRESKKQRSE
jgi:hypothetical protein